MSPLDCVLDRLEFKKSGNGYLARCPAHDDRRASLSIATGDDGRVLLYCHAGCSLEVILATLGLTQGDLFPKATGPVSQGPSHLAQQYDYVDEDGNLLFQALRYVPKKFSQRRPDGNGGWIYNIDGIQRVLYRLPEVVAADAVHIVEGEKDADRLRELGLTATTNPQGAGKWREEYSQRLQGKRVVILPDNDEAGEKHAQSVAHSVLPLAASVKIVRLPGLPAKGDVSDWLDAAHTKEELLALVAATPELRAEDSKKENSGFQLTPLGDLLNEQDEEVAWLIDGLLPTGGFSLLVGKPKTGKTTLARKLALSVSRNEPFLSRATLKGPVIYLALEEKRSEVRKHFRQMGATGTEEIYVHAASAPADALEQIRVLARTKKAGLIIIDPLFRFTRVKDSNDYAQVTAALEPLLVLARETGAHVLVVHHAGKSDRDGGDSILGSTAIFAAVDTALILKRSDRYRTLQSIQRYGEDLPETVLKFDPLTRSLTLGEGKEQEETNRLKETILAVLQAQENDLEKGRPLTEVELNEEVEGRNAHKRKALRELSGGDSGDKNSTAKNGDKKTRIVRRGKGGKADPFRYCLENSRFVVPPHTGGQGDKNTKNDATPQKDSRHSCPRASGVCEEEEKTPGQQNFHADAREFDGDQDRSEFNWQADEFEEID